MTDGQTENLHYHSLRNDKTVGESGPLRMQVRTCETKLEHVLRG